MLGGAGHTSSCRRGHDPTVQRKGCLLPLATNEELTWALIAESQCRGLATLTYSWIEYARMCAAHVWLTSARALTRMKLRRPCNAGLLRQSITEGAPERLIQI